MLFGQKELVIDDKGRLVMPSLFRSQFNGGTCYVSLGLDNCIEVYPEAVYQKRVEKIMSLNDFDPKARSIKRTYLSNSFDVQIDSHSRILIPKPLSEKTKAIREVTVVGMYDHLEIWDSQTFLARSSLEEKDFSKNAQELVG